MGTASTLSRRTFLSLAATLPLAARLRGAAKIPVGLELYSVRNELSKDLFGTVKTVAKMGYEVVEFYSPYYQWTPQMASDVRKLLDDVGLKCHSTHNGADAFAPGGVQKAIDLNKTIGSHLVVMASPGGEIAGADGWKKVADTLNAAQETLKAAGMSAGYHNHGPEWKALDGGKRAMDILAANTSKDVVLQLDVGTCVASGADPVAWINANPGRIKTMHCKDWKAGEKQYAVNFGDGDAPWKAIFDAAEKTGGIQFYLIEQEAGPENEQFQRADQSLKNFKKLRTT
jgi:sugar phosphate isomerase/epimerase